MKDLNSVNKEAWNAYQEDYFQFQLMERPDYFAFFSGGGVDLDEYLLQMIGPVTGLRLLDTCCACDAVQAFSWHNRGAVVTACDITEKAIEIASRNAAQMKLSVDFVVADMQTLAPIRDEAYDIVFATYPVWVQDIEKACKTWNRVLKKGGRLLWHMEHPITSCIAENESGLRIKHSYNAPITKLYDCFDGTPMAERQGGFHTDLPSAEHFWRISNIINAVCRAGFRITEVQEAAGNPGSEEYDAQISNLPNDFALLAVK